MTAARLVSPRRRAIDVGCLVSSTLFTVALVTLLLPWHETRDSRRSGIEFLFPVGVRGLAAVMTLVGLSAMGAALILGMRGTRGAAIVRAVIAGVALAPFLLHLAWSWALGGDSAVLGPDNALVGAWLSFCALVAALVTNLVLARRPSC